MLEGRLEGRGLLLDEFSSPSPPKEGRGGRGVIVPWVVVESRSLVLPILKALGLASPTSRAGTERQSENALNDTQWNNKVVEGTVTVADSENRIPSLLM